jgi:hypothetical protein
MLLNFKLFLEKNWDDPIRDTRTSSKHLSTFRDPPGILNRFAGDLASGIGGFYNHVKDQSVANRNTSSYLSSHTNNEIYYNEEKKEINVKANEYDILYMRHAHNNNLIKDKTTNRPITDSSHIVVRDKANSYLAIAYSKNEHVRNLLNNLGLMPINFTYKDYQFCKNNDNDDYKYDDYIDGENEKLKGRVIIITYIQKKN